MSSQNEVEFKLKLDSQTHLLSRIKQHRPQVDSWAVPTAPIAYRPPRISTTHFPYRSPRCFNNNTFPLQIAKVFQQHIPTSLVHWSHHPQGLPPPPPLGKYTSSFLMRSQWYPGLNKTGTVCVVCGANNQPAGKQSARRQTGEQWLPCKLVFMAVFSLWVSQKPRPWTLYKESLY